MSPHYYCRYRNKGGYSRKGRLQSKEAGFYGALLTNDMNLTPANEERRRQREGKREDGKRQRREEGKGHKEGRGEEEINEKRRKES